MAVINGIVRAAIALATAAALTAIVAALAATIVAGALFLFRPVLYGAGRRVASPVAPGPLWPAQDEGPLSRDLPPTPTPLGQAVVSKWTENPLRSRGENPVAVDSKDFVARLATGSDVEEINRQLQAVVPWKLSGSSYLWRKGDYDFTETGFVTMLYLFGDDPERLYPETVKHLVDVLLLEKGSTPRPMVPGSLGRVGETENHILMGESCRYLGNQWEFTHGGENNPSLDNKANGLEAWLKAHLELTRDQGFFEFNSDPYQFFCMHALLNLEAFAASPEISKLARHLLDTLGLHFALGSLDFRRYPPMRRRNSYATLPGLFENPGGYYFRVWCSPLIDSPDPDRVPWARGDAAMLAEVLPYRLPPDVAAWIVNKPHEYFVQFGRGRKASPGIYSGGPDYLISAGGANRGWFQLVIARPIVLMLRDGAADYRECFHISTPSWKEQRNNTGVHRRFACGNTPVSVPEAYMPAAASGDWSVYAPECAEGLLVAVCSAPKLGVLALFPDSIRTPQQLVEAVAAANPSLKGLRSRFAWPEGGSIAYDVNASQDTWVIKAVNDVPVDRAYDTWPRMAGDPPTISFNRSAGATDPAASHTGATTSP